MKKEYPFNEPITVDKVINYAKASTGLDYSADLGFVLKNAFADFRNLPELGYPKKIASNKIKCIDLNEYVGKLCLKYLKGYKSRPSIKIGNKSKTYSDPIIDIALEARSKKLTPEDITKVTQGHKLLMTLENLIGDILEEYLSLKLRQFGWYCCWGSSIDAVDFCHQDGRLLQVKNSDNSENSSSSRVRNGTKIIKWARRISTKDNEFKWDYLINETGANNVSELDFRRFLKDLIEANPACIYTKDQIRFD